MRQCLSGAEEVPRHFRGVMKSGLMGLTSRWVGIQLLGYSKLCRHRYYGEDIHRSVAEASVILDWRSGKGPSPWLD